MVKIDMTGKPGEYLIGVITGIVELPYKNDAEKIQMIQEYIADWKRVGAKVPNKE